ncbi:hypothetical protein PLICRDRAFT_138678 [Plicaturopsis crispa FD-325 SS-3]|nr:hypothetical protein PLICRDRAFT_138678 [Plicaturopsis crispa FD-325 SS-3]
MDAAAHKITEAATYKTLHAQGFSRSSSQASLVLTDLLSRYLTLLSSTCAKYAQHAGRTGLTVYDATSALEEMGVSLEELSEYCGSEGNELRRYAQHTGRRVEDLNELKAHLAEGLKQDRDDAIPLTYTRVPSETASDDSDAYDEEDEADDFAVEELPPVDNAMEIDIPQSRRPSMDRKEEGPGLRPPSTPPLPLSPISNPSSPARKRARTSSWRPPPHIPNFLPPFPSDRDASSSLPHISDSPPPFQPPPLKLEEPPIPLPQPQTLPSTSASDYLTPVPYSQSTLSATPEWHLPGPPPRSHALQTRSNLPTPPTQPALIAAYHHILTHPPPANLNVANPSRHKVTMALLRQTETSPRWEPPDTLFSSIAPCPPRVAPIGPSFPIPIGTFPPTGSEGKHKEEEKERKSGLPSAPPRSISFEERLTPLISQQPSRIPELARHVLPGSVYTRTTRINHPPVLHRGNQKLTYGPGVNAPWNANVGGATAGTPTLGKGASSNGQPNGKGKEVAAPKPLPDARMYATWDYDQKHFFEPLPAGRRGRMGSSQSSSGVTLSLGGKGRSASKPI